MAQFEPGVYEPSGSFRPLGGKFDESGYEEEATRLPLLIVIALVVLASFGGVVWLAYTQGVERGREDGPRAGVPQRTARSGLKREIAPYASLKIYRSPQSNRRLTQGGMLPAPKAADEPAAPTLPRVSSPAGAIPAPNSHPLVPPPKTTPPKPVTTILATAATPSNSSAIRTSESAESGYVLQIGSYKSAAEANASWQVYKGAHAAAAGYGPDIQRAELGKRGTWYRLRIGPFATLAQAGAVCVKLRAQGGSCFPAKRLP